MSNRNAPPIDELVEAACQGASEPLRALLLRRGGLPGPRPNFKLASSTAEALAAQGIEGRKLIDDLRSMSEQAAPAGSPHPILPVVGVLGLGCLAVRARDHAERRALVHALHEHADDARREVRDAVVLGLGLVLQEHPAETLTDLASWSDGYFHAVLMLQAISEPSFLQKIADARMPLARVQESFALAADAPRAHQRSQGYRALVRSVKQALVAFGKRFPQPVAAWLEEHVQVATEDLREAMRETIEQLRSEGLREQDARAVFDALAAAVLPPRDPRWDVGSTRRRGKKARRKGRR